MFSCLESFKKKDNIDELNFDFKAFENRIRNTFKWDWFEEKGSNDGFLHKFMQNTTKLDVDMCLYSDYT